MTEAKLAPPLEIMRLLLGGVLSRNAKEFEDTATIRRE